MSTSDRLARAGRWTALGLGLSAAAYAGYVGAAWLRYGRTTRPPDEADPLLDEFMPIYDVAERHQIAVRAPAAVTLRAAASADMNKSLIIRAIFRARETVLGAQPSRDASPKSLFEAMQSLGWRVLAEQPERGIVVGAVTQPWLANVTFRGLSPEDFKRFQEPDFVKIAWTLRADPVNATESVFRTETRVATTDATARAKFRWYWARFSPGILLIRRSLLRQVKRDAERLR